MLKQVDAVREVDVDDGASFTEDAIAELLAEMPQAHRDLVLYLVRRIAELTRAVTENL